ncbi:zinc finger protein 37-like isoform X4 [Dreissena polymorpha]|uniref:zinc finger protein 37-like isoform X4 n=1 Tax=Dreissena polymorpha TaxID=45954 RepID=UPI002263EED9|nr:zinc finger protein 37-like isoform X4 [Dreissena polymorpha]
MATDVEDSEMEGSPEFKHALKMVLKRQMKDLINQICEQGIEIAVMEVNINDGSTSHFGTPIGESFIAEQKSLTHSFASFCKTNGRISSDVPSDRSPRRRVEKKITPMSKSRPSTSTDPPTLRITVPRRLSVGISEQELGGLVGRIVASQLDKNKEKGDGSSGGTKFDALLESVKAKEKPLNVTRSGRKVSNKFLEGLKSSKKSIKAEESESGDEGSSEKLIGRLSDLETQAMKKVQVKTGDGKSVDVQKTTLVQGDQLESLAAAIIKELQRVPNIADRKQVKVIVTDNAAESHVRVDLTHEPPMVENVKLESIEDDSEMEYLMGDEEEDFGDADDDKTEGKADASSISGAVPLVATPKQAVKKTDTPGSSTSVTTQLVRKKKYPKPLIERMPMECEHCGQTVAGKSNLKSHIRRVHLKVKNHKCTICTKGFWSNNALESHMLSVHTRRCDNCQEYVVESVPWGNGVDMRMKRDVICTCGSIVSIYSSFGRKRMYLREDEPDEEGELPPTRPKSSTGTKYACGTCGKLFMKKSNCERHSRAHTDYKGVICNICGSAFTYENSLKKHLETEHGIVKHVCDLCGKNYSNEVALKVHYIKAHGEENIIGDNLVMIVKEKSEGTPNLEDQMEEIMEGEDDEELANQLMENGRRHGQTEHIVVTSRPDGRGEQHIVVTGTADLDPDMIIAGHDGHIMVSHSEIAHLEAGQIMVTQGEGGQVQVTSGDPGLTQDSAQRIVQQAIQEGHMIAGDRNMSIIIKQLPMGHAEVEMTGVTLECLCIDDSVV